MSSRELILREEYIVIKFSAYDAFLEKPSSGTLKIERLESQISYYDTVLIISVILLYLNQSYLSLLSQQHV